MRKFKGIRRVKITKYNKTKTIRRKVIKKNYKEE